MHDVTPLFIAALIAFAQRREIVSWCRDFMEEIR